MFFGVDLSFVGKAFGCLPLSFQSICFPGFGGLYEARRRLDVGAATRRQVISSQEMIQELCDEKKSKGLRLCLQVNNPKKNELGWSRRDHFRRCAIVVCLFPQKRNLRKQCSFSTGLVGGFVHVFQEDWTSETRRNDQDISIPRQAEEQDAHTLHQQGNDQLFQKNSRENG